MFDVIKLDPELKKQVEDSTKKYRLPLLFIFLGLVILVYVRNLSNPSLVMMILGGISATSGLIWQVVTRILANRGL